MLSKGQSGGSSTPPSGSPPVPRDRHPVDWFDCLGCCQARIVADYFGVVRRVQLVESFACNILASLREHNFLLRVDFDHLILKLIADERVPIRQPDCPAGKWAGIGHVTTPRQAGCVIVEHNLFGWSNCQDAVIVGIGNQSLPIGQAAGKSCAAQPVARARAVAPDNLLIAVDFDDLASSSALLGLLSSSAPQPASPVFPYCQTILLFKGLTSITR